MATPLSATWQLAALKAEGCKVVEYKSWRTHNRNHKGAWGPVNGVMIHHTVTSGTALSVRLCYDGYSSLPGPLCHTVGAKDGTLYMVGNGRANHAGSGDDDVLRAVVDERDLPPDNEANTDGNRHFYGIELINLGDGKDPWPPEQVDAAARWAAALCRAHGWNERSVIGHLEWQPGKIDPRGFTMNTFRTRVKSLLSKPAGWQPSPPAPAPQETDMPHTLGRYDTKDRPLIPGKWTTLTIDGVDLIAGATAYQAMVQLTASVPEGATLQGRFYHSRPDGSRWDSGITERLGTAGHTFADFHNAGSVKPDEKVRFEAVYYPVDPADQKSITVTTSRARGLYWK
ncbi:MAG TPA: N-acetylmuramoyl-L-alanine amidase [Streptomyces sp.]|nr:N-acetylmuramoyl-L-alanine amidase [Streptomyces sp.]